MISEWVSVSTCHRREKPSEKQNQKPTCIPFLRAPDSRAPGQRSARPGPCPRMRRWTGRRPTSRRWGNPLRVTLGHSPLCWHQLLLILLAIFLRMDGSIPEPCERVWGVRVLTQMRGRPEEQHQQPGQHYHQGTQCWHRVITRDWGCVTTLRALYHCSLASRESGNHIFWVCIK